MSKIFKFINLLIFIILLSLLFSGCSYIDHSIRINKEKIGNEYIVYENGGGDSHGSEEGYSVDSDSHSITIKFNSMNSTQDYTVNIEPDDTLEVNTNIEEGKVWVKITQGDLNKSDIQSELIPNNETKIITLDKWDSGEIVVWIVVEDGVNGEININHMS